jgi:hypothetical protein
MMNVKVYNAYRKVVAVCDEGLIGKRFTEGEGQKLLDVKESFYSGELMSKEKALMIIKSEAADDATFNFVGKESVELAIEAGIIDKKGIMKMQGIPYALSLL